METSTFLGGAVAWVGAGVALWAAWSVRRSAAAGVAIEFRADIQSDPVGISLIYEIGPARVRRVRVQSVTKGVLRATAVPIERPGDRAIVPALSSVPAGTILRLTCHVPGIGRIARVLENPNQNPVFCY